MSFLINIVAGLQFKSIFTQKDDLAVLFSWQLSELSNLTNFKKALLYEKRGSDIYQKSNYVTFYLKPNQDFCISGSDNGLDKVLSVEKNK